MAVRGLARVLVVLLWSGLSSAQMRNGVLVGTVKDSTGAVVLSANVTLTQSETGLRLKVATDAYGNFQFSQLRAGIYQLTIDHSGFATAQSGASLAPGEVSRVEFTLTPQSISDTVSVTAEQVAINVDNALLSERVDEKRVDSLPLNGRNVYDLLKQAPGSISTSAVSFESGAGVSVNGVRPNFNGFFVDGSSVKRLSGGYSHPLIKDSVAEFQLLTLNNSSEFGSSAGAISNLVTKSGTNSFHGSSWYAFRNDALEATPFFLRQSGTPKPPLRFHQMGATVGGPLKRERLFYFLAYENSRFRTSTAAAPALAESPEFRAAVRSIFPNSVAALLYKDFAPSTVGATAFTLNQYVQGPDGIFGGTAFSGSGIARFSDYLCADRTGPVYSARFAALFGVTAQDQAELAGRCSVIPAVGSGAFNRNQPLLQSVPAEFATRTQGNLFQGQQSSARLDWNESDKHRFSLKSNMFFSSDEFAGVVPGFNSDVITTAIRGFKTPADYFSPEVSGTWTWFVSPGVANDLRASYVGAFSKITASDPGVPSISLLDGTLGFGASAGFPRDFREHTYSIGDSLNWAKGRHSLRAGADVRWNRENSDFNIGRPTYLFYDPLFFAVDAPFLQAAGVVPGITAGQSAQLSSNIRHFGNYELGLYFADDWRLTSRLTLSLGLRYDIFGRHQEQDDLATTFLMGPGHEVIDDLRTGAGRVRSASAFAGTSGCSTTAQIATAQLVGVCGPGGFAPAKQLGRSDLNDLAPRLGFAWDVFGKGKTAVRGGFGMSYEGTLYDMLSFSRYNLPYYSLNQVTNFLAGDINRIAYGPQTPGLEPTYRGFAPPNQFSGEGPQGEGNINAWEPANPNLSAATGIVPPEGLRDPYVMNWFMGLQQQISRSWTLEANYVATAGRKLFRSEDVNRIPGARLPTGTCITDEASRTVCSQTDLTIGTQGRPLNATGKLNPNYGTLRVWRNAVSSSYNGLQLSLRRRGDRINVFAHYTWSHSIDGGSTWFSTFTTANGAAAGEGFTTDQTRPQLDRGNSVFDVRQRLTLDFQWLLPTIGGNGKLSKVFSGWSVSGITSMQTGAHWSPFDPRPRVLRALTAGACSSATFDRTACVNAGGDYNLDGQANDRPSASASNVAANFGQWASGFNLPASFFSAPCLGCASNLGRNSFVGPGFWATDLSISRRVKLRERATIEMRADAFNTFNRTNFQLPGNAGHNRINDPQFGKAGGTFNPRQIQVQLRVSF